MALTAANVRVAVTGAVYVAPTATAAPTASDTALNAAFKDLGYVSEDGITVGRSRSTTQIRAWQNAAIVRESVTESAVSISLTLIESNPDVLALYYGTAHTGGHFEVSGSATGGRHSFVIDVVDGDEVIRHYIADGEVTEVGDQVFSNGEPVGYEITITAYENDGVAVDVFHSSLEA